MNIVLIGFMGSGKSAVGQRLAERLGYDFVDTDLLVEEKAGKSIGEIFQGAGEEAFRQMESEVIAEVAERKEAVISCGGGVVLNPTNIELLKREARIVYLKGDPASLYERVKNSRERPLLQVSAPQEEFERIFAQRKEKYEDSADLVVEVDDKKEIQIADEIIRLLGAISWNPQ